MNIRATRLKIYVLIFLFVLIAGITGFVIIEDRNVLDSVYFTIVTMSTVGYGDIHARTDAGKMLSVFIIIMGVGTFVGVISSLTELMLNRREEEARMKKLNIVIGVFFSEIGTSMLNFFVPADPDIKIFRESLAQFGDNENMNMKNIQGILKSHSYEIEFERIPVENLRDALVMKKDFLLRLLENPVLVEQENFTNLLRGTFHFYEELMFRTERGPVDHNDAKHLKGDIMRIYRLLVPEWFNYMQYLKKEYPYLFMHSMNINPFK